MAKKEEKKIERTYNVPLRREWLKSPKYKRSKKAITGLRIFLIRHMIWLMASSWASSCRISISSVVDDDQQVPANRAACTRLLRGEIRKCSKLPLASSLAASWAAYVL